MAEVQGRQQEQQQRDSDAIKLPKLPGDADANGKAGAKEDSQQPLKKGIERAGLLDRNYMTLRWPLNKAKAQWDSAEKLQTQARQFRSDLVRLGRSGYQPFIDSVLTSTPGLDSARVFTSSLKHIESARRPANLLPTAWQYASVVPPELSSIAKELPLTPFSLRSKEEGDSVIVELIDYLQPNDPVVERQTFAAKDDASVQEQIKQYISELVPRLKKIAAADARSLQREIQSQPALIPPGFYMMPEVRMNQAQQATLSKLLDDYPTIRVHANIRSQPFEVYRYIYAEFGETELRNNGFKALSIGGPVRRLTFEQTVAVPEEKRADQKRSESLSEYTDRFGNYIAHTRSYAGRGKETAVERITVQPPTYFGDDKTQCEVMRDFKVDLTKLGYGILQGFAYDLGVPKLPQGGQPAVYSSISADRVEKEFEQRLQKLQIGVRAAAAQLGLTGTIQRIHLIDSNRPNAFITRANLDSVSVLDEILRHQKTLPMDALAYHELVHILDARHDFQLSGGAFGEHYKQLMKRDSTFVNLIDEKRFFNFSMGGHSADNEKEFLASFLNSLRHPQWEKELGESYISFKKNYLATMQVLEKHLVRIDPKLAETPMYRELLSKRKKLEQLILKDPDAKPGQ